MADGLSIARAATADAGRILITGAHRSRATYLLWMFYFFYLLARLVRVWRSAPESVLPRAGSTPARQGDGLHRHRRRRRDRALLSAALVNAFGRASRCRSAALIIARVAVRSGPRGAPTTLALKVRRAQPQPEREPFRRADLNTMDANLQPATQSPPFSKTLRSTSRSAACAQSARSAPTSI
jgi:hypothetical protein